MRTILITGSGTGVGKTQVAAGLARAASRRGRNIQIVKPVQTGVGPGEPTDADVATTLAGAGSASSHTLRRYPAALTPLAAAAAAGARLQSTDLVMETLGLPAAAVRLVEGAGGIAVPLGENGWDWVDFAAAIDADGVVIVVPVMLGAINLARLAHHYFQSKGGKTMRGGVVLNSIAAPEPALAASIRSALADCAVPVWGELGAGSLELAMRSPLANWFRQ